MLIQNYLSFMRQGENVETYLVLLFEVFIICFAIRSLKLILTNLDFDILFRLLNINDMNMTVSFLLAIIMSL